MGIIRVIGLGSSTNFKYAYQVSETKNPNSIDDHAKDGGTGVV